ncbi:MAG: sugar phosphate isomerase/epimerase [Clostridia bacterium]|nr:sugar phosphate isomerase/epimerase [Clostridia bacterium]MBR5365719.1 sugar phosphate isomerase/epimerase [Clostridia bacterium]
MGTERTIRIVTTTAVFQPGYPAEDAADRLARLGFEALDMALDYWCSEGSPFLGEGYRGWAASLRERAEKNGVPYTHAHAPGEAGSAFIVGRAIETTGLLNAKYMVLHPVWREEDRIIEDASRFIAVNAEAVKPWLAEAERCGVTILSENLLWGASRDPRIISDLVRAVDSPFFGWCFDTGHANCFGYAPHILRECAVPPSSLHLQDNHGASDEHLIPGDGTIDWDAMAEALGECGYAGDCVLEAHHQSLDAPDDERDAILTRLLAVARPFREKMAAREESGRFSANAPDEFHGKPCKSADGIV